jgi:hypothetical protein
LYSSSVGSSATSLGLIAESGTATEHCGQSVSSECDHTQRDHTFSSSHEVVHDSRCRRGDIFDLAERCGKIVLHLLNLAAQKGDGLVVLHHLAGRQTTGFVTSLFALLKIDKAVPDQATLSRRRGALPLTLPVKALSGARHLVIDSTGVKVYGEGECKVRQQGWSKRRTWRKLHLGVDAATGEIVAAWASTNDLTDAQMLPELLTAVDGEVEQVSADGAYDQRPCYEAIGQRQARAAIPPRKGARSWQPGNTKAERHIRDENLRQIRRVGKKAWKEASNYHQRSLAELVGWMADLT